MAIDIDREAQRRAQEWKRFRGQYLFRQTDLASALGCCRRTVSAVERGEHPNPTVPLLRRFAALKARHEQGNVGWSKKWNGM